jgi:serine protease Do
MSTTKQFRLTTMIAVALAAMALGMVLTGGLGVTPESAAEHASGGAQGAAAAAPAPIAAGYPNFADLAEKVIPSVISVLTTDTVDRNEMRRFHKDVDPFDFFFGPNMNPNSMRPPVRRGAGSGFFISTDGLALTNNHVVEGAEKIEVRLSMDDNSRLPAKVVGRDPSTDLALIKVEGKGPYTPLTLGDSEALRVGDWVMAVGNPLNMPHTVTAGVVSAKGRQLGLSPETQSFENFIQTDAAINLGNSGGPLVNLRGEVVGINSAINAAGQNIGFAIPVNTVKSVLPQLKEKGKVTRGYLGVQIQNVTEDIQDAFTLPSRDGAFVQSVEETGPAGKAGIQKGDTIVAVNGATVKETRALIDTISGMPPERKVDLDVIRDGKRRSITVTLGERPSTNAEDEQSGSASTSPSSKLGFEVEDLTARTRRGFEIPNSVEGVVVTDVESGSVADDAGLRQGDVVTEAGGKEVATARDLMDSLKNVHSGAAVRLYVYRPQLDRSTFVIMRMP